MKINAKGWELYHKWEDIYYNELKRLQESDPNFCEGWSIIDNTDFVKTPDDIVGLYLFGYDDNVFNVIREWKESNLLNGTDRLYNHIDLTVDKLEERLKEYFEEEMQ